MDRIIYVFAGAYLSARQTDALIAGLEAAAPVPAQAIRLDGRGQGLWAALDRAVSAGAHRVEIRPVGVPFSESLAKWLPGAAGSWLSKRSDRAVLSLSIAAPASADPEVIRAVAGADVPSRPVLPRPQGHLGKGWDRPPDFAHHLLVCVGPRCHMLEAPSLLDALKGEIGAAGLSRDCLVTATGCLFPCNGGPVVVHYPSGLWHRLGSAADIGAFVTRFLARGEALPHLVIHRSGVSHAPA